MNPLPAQRTHAGKPDAVAGLHQAQTLDLLRRLANHLLGVGDLRDDDGLDGPVYAPWLGQLQKGYSFYPAAHWVALEDMIRGPGRATENHPGTRALLEPSIDPGGPAYILANRPLETYPFLAFLEDYYVLESDYGDRFKALRVLPKRWDHGWPRYLYRHRGAGVGPE